MNRQLRLRGSAVSLSREAHKAQRKLDQLKRARLTAALKPAPTLQPPANPDQPITATALGLTERAPEAVPLGTEKGSVPAFSLSLQQSRAARQSAENPHDRAEQARRQPAMPAAIAGAPAHSGAPHPAI